ncbi:MAG: hemerythrin domain-containing protein [Solirubrobacterales bacterium]|nr:hemerythrin domain-containing protein [Solirubrobacterales bacterium]
MMAVADEFARIFRTEHREVRDVLLDLLGAVRRGSAERMRPLLERAATVTGPHFRYEEEALYPLLEDIYGHAYVEHLFEEHDEAVAASKRLIALAGGESLDSKQAEEATGLVRRILPHVSDCEGLSIIVEVLPGEAVDSILAARKRAREAGLGLIEWADGVRPSPIRAAGRGWVSPGIGALETEAGGSTC